MGWLCTGQEASEGEPGEPGEHGNRVQSQQSSLRVTAEPREARCWGAGVRLGRERDGVSRDPIFEDVILHIGPSQSW